MMESLQLYSNENFSVRTMQDAEGVVWFVGRDIAQCLEYSETTINSSMSNLFQAVPNQWKGKKRILTVERGEQEMLCLTEQGVYFFLGRSDKPKALPYQMWIAGEVVPSIRKTGGYNARKTDPALPSGVIDGARVIFETAGLRENQLALALDKVYRSYTGRSALRAGENILYDKRHSISLRIFGG